MVCDLILNFFYYIPSLNQTITLNPNEINQNDLYKLGIAAAATICLVVPVTLFIKKLQNTKAKDEIDLESIYNFLTRKIIKL